MVTENYQLLGGSGITLTIDESLKTVTAATGDGEVFPVILTTCAYATGHDDAELLGKFDVGQGSADLLGKATVQ